MWQKLSELDIKHSEIKKENFNGHTNRLLKAFALKVK